MLTESSLRTYRCLSYNFTFSMYLKTYMHKRFFINFKDKTSQWKVVTKWIEHYHCY